MKLTKREIDSLTRPAAGEAARLYWDTDLQGFGLRVTPTRTTYVAQGRVNGRTVRVTLGRHGPLTPDAARALAKTRLGEMAHGVDHNRRAKVEKLTGTTLTQAYDAYVATKPLGENTKRDYERAMRIAFESWKETPIAQITGQMVLRRFEVLSETTPVQANQMFRFLRALLGWAMWRFAREDGTPLVPTNPCEILTKLKRWNRVNRRDRHVEPPQLPAFMAALAPDSEDSDHRAATKDLCALLILTGLREQEGCRLRWDDVDLDGRRLVVRHTKNHRVHTLPIGHWLAARLRARKTSTRGTTHVFPADNAVGHLRNHRKDVLAIGKAAGVDFRLHDLRRTFASIVNHYLERSLSAYTIKRLLNHSTDGDVTAGYIQHPVETLREPIELVERYVLRVAGLVASAPVAQLPTSLGRSPVDRGARAQSTVAA
jgi:integrase